jgi:hypothetical protein
MTLDHPLADRQAEARAVVVALGVEPLEDDENSFGLLRIDPFLARAWAA